MLLFQIRAALQQLKSVQKPELERFLLQISLISSLMDCPGPGSVSGELHSARPWFFPQGMSQHRPPPIPVLSPSCAKSSLARGNKTASSPSHSMKPTSLSSDRAEGRQFAARCIPLFMTPGPFHLPVGGHG